MISIGLHRPTVSETFDLLSPNIGVLNEVRRASCPDAVIPGFAKRLAAKSFLGVVPVSSLTQLAGPPIPVLPLRVVNAGGDGDGGSSRTTEVALRGRYEAALERITAAYRRSHSHRNGVNGDEVESATTRPILPGQKTLIRIRKNPSLSLGISLIGGSETSLVRLHPCSLVIYRSLVVKQTFGRLEFILLTFSYSKWYFGGLECWLCC